MTDQKDSTSAGQSNESSLPESRFANPAPEDTRPGGPVTRREFLELAAATALLAVSSVSATCLSRSVSCVFFSMLTQITDKAEALPM